MITTQSTFRPAPQPASRLSYQGREKINRGMIHGIMVLVSLMMVLPLIEVISVSFSQEQDIAKYGYTLIPRHFTLAAYQYIFSDPSTIIDAYGVTFAVTVLGTGFGLLFSSMLAYSLARRDYELRRPISLILFFTLLFSGGMVPSYILVTQYLHLQDTLLALILPGMISAWNVLLLRAFFSALPQELIDAAKIDGASEWRIFFQMVIPLSTPALATIGSFMLLMYWNDWSTALLYINNQQLYPLQYLLYQISSNIDFISNNATASSYNITVPVESVRMAMVVIATGPIVFVFLFLQRYFVRGITLGGLKGD
ncbi:MAG TPA: carbohydrate ABC transporter permease [Ktedonobacteraceae bacterium]|nr:carbohydrate ABC transporter permease [Ktedonobacteraceae bacterium]